MQAGIKYMLLALVALAIQTYLIYAHQKSKQFKDLLNDDKKQIDAMKSAAAFGVPFLLGLGLMAYLAHRQAQGEMPTGEG
jgi:hypothetical protein